MRLSRHRNKEHIYATLIWPLPSPSGHPAPRRKLTAGSRTHSRIRSRRHGARHQGIAAHGHRFSLGSGGGHARHGADFERRDQRGRQRPQSLVSQLRSHEGADRWVEVGRHRGQGYPNVVVPYRTALYQPARRPGCRDRWLPGRQSGRNRGAQNRKIGRGARSDGDARCQSDERSQFRGVGCRDLEGRRAQDGDGQRAAPRQVVSNRGRRGCRRSDFDFRRRFRRTAAVPI